MKYKYDNEGFIEATRLVYLSKYRSTDIVKFWDRISIYRNIYYEN